MCQYWSKSEAELRSELMQYFDEKNFSEAKRALEYASLMHEGQKRRNGQPFIIHPLYVAKIIIDVSTSVEEDLLSVALLHDVCEDCGTEPENLPFGKVAQDAVRRMTFKYDFAENDSKAEKLRKKTAIKRATFAGMIDDPIALICKGADRYHNLATIEELEECDIVKNVLETHRLLLPVMDKAMSLRKYSQYHDQLSALSKQLRLLTTNLAEKYQIDLD